MLSPAPRGYVANCWVFVPLVLVTIAAGHITR